MNSYAKESLPGIFLLVEVHRYKQPLDLAMMEGYSATVEGHVCS